MIYTADWGITNPPKADWFKGAGRMFGADARNGALFRGKGMETGPLFLSFLYGGMSGAYAGKTGTISTESVS
jgi:hypothetical protein